MDDTILLYQPPKKARLKESVYYTLPLFRSIISTCSRYLIAAAGKENVDAAVTDHYIDLFWRANFAATFTSLYVAGLDHIDRQQNYIYMSNHASWMDIPAIFGAVPSSVRMVSKVGLMKVPIFGHAMKVAGFIAIDRQKRSLAIRQLEVAKKRLNEGLSIWMAPEGTRSRDGVIRPFKKGGFYLAKELNMPIMPVYIEGAGEVMPADGLLVRPNRSITVHFCKPVSSDDVLQMSTDQIMSTVRERMLEKQRSCTEQLAGEKA